MAIPADWGPMSEWTLPRVLRSASTRHPERDFIQVERGSWLNYRQVLESSELTAGRLAGLGVERGDRVLILSRLSEELIFTWFGTNLLGAADVSLNPALRGQALVHAVNLPECEVLVVQDELLAEVRQVEEQLSHLKHIVVIGRSDTAIESWPTRHLRRFDLIEPVDVSWPEPSPSEIASIIYTSGTTGPAKGVINSHAQVYVNARQSIDGLRMTADDTFYCFHPLFHMAAKFYAVLASAVVGARVSLVTAFDPARWLAQVRQLSATVSMAHGPMIEMIHAEQRRLDDDDNPLRALIAAPLPRGIGANFERRFGVRAIETWGMTEVTCPTWQPYDGPRPVGSSGKVIDELFEVTLVDEAGIPVAVGETGEITVRPRLPWIIMQGYYGMPDATVDAWRDLRFHTGDAGRFDADGYLYFVDRVADRIRRKAENISSYDIEIAAAGHPGVAECAAVGIDAERSGDDEIKLTVVPAAGRAIDPAELLLHLVRELPHHMVPRYIEVTSALPRSVTNKVQKAMLRRSGAEGCWDRREAGLSVRDLRKY